MIEYVYLFGVMQSEGGILEVREELCRHDNHDLSSTGKGRTTTSDEITKLYHRFTVQNSMRIKETLFLPAHETGKTRWEKQWCVLYPLTVCPYVSGFDNEPSRVLTPG